MSFVRPGVRRIAFTFAALVAPLATAKAQQVLDAKSVAHLRQEYAADVDTLHSKIVALAQAIPADKYSWRPAKGVRSISEVFMHVTGEFYFWGPRSVGGNPPADFGDPKVKTQALEKITAKDSVLAHIHKSFAHYKAQLAAVDPATHTGPYPPWNMPFDRAMLAMLDDLHEHLGQLIAYARSVGVTPPWSK